MSKPVFSKETIAAHGVDFNSTFLPNYYGKREIIDNWIARVKSGRIATSKEEEIKSSFINDIFGNVLGFRENSNEWLLLEEAKTKFDGTKPDGALGYFTNNKNYDDVRAVIEIKGPKTDLDKKNGKTGKSAIDQAFEYAPKMDRRCLWVIVSNISEIRFYNARSRMAYQSYQLCELEQPDIFNELLLLFHKDNFILRNAASKTDRLYEQIGSAIQPIRPPKSHIIDQLFYSLKRFEGLHFVDPRYISNLHPFNVLDEYVWHYNDQMLFTLNPEIFNLLQEIEILEGSISITDKYQKQLQKEKVADYSQKLAWVMEFLNKSYIKEITAIQDYQKIADENRAVIGFTNRNTFKVKEGQITKNILFFNPSSCDCMSCNYKNFDFKRLLEKLQSADGEIDNYDLELGYANYLVAAGNYKKAYSIYRRLENNKYKPGKGLTYFLVRLNLKNLHNLIESSYDGTNRKQILQYLRAIDIDHLIHYELEPSIDHEVRKYLIQIKEDRLIAGIREKTIELNEKTKKLKDRYDDGNSQIGGLNLARQIERQFHLLYLHVNRNFIIADIFNNYQKITVDVTASLLNNHETPKVGLPSLNHFFITEAILHVPADELTSMLKNVTLLKIDTVSLSRIVSNSASFFRSFYIESKYAFDPLPNSEMIIHLQNYSFKEKLCRIFSNIWAVIQKSEITAEQFIPIIRPLKIFLRQENILAHFNLQRLCDFLHDRGDYFSSDDLEELLTIFIEREKFGNIKYNLLITTTALTIHKFYPEKTVTSKALINRAIINCNSLTSDRQDYSHIIFLLKITDPDTTSLLLKAFKDYLSKAFNHTFYGKMLRNNLHTGLGTAYFDSYLSHIIKTGITGRIFEAGKSRDDISDFTVYNFKFAISLIGHNLTSDEIKLFSHFPSYERWLIDPHGFNYEEFEVYWLHDLPLDSKFVEELSVIQVLRERIDKELRVSFNPHLAALYYKDFNGGAVS